MHFKISRLWSRYQPSLFPNFDSSEDTTTEFHRRIIFCLDELSEIIDVAINCLSDSHKGRKKIDRTCFVYAFISMRILNISLTKTLIDRLKVDSVLRRICKFDCSAKLPCEATFSNAFAELSKAMFIGFCIFYTFSYLQIYYFLGLSEYVFI